MKKYAAHRYRAAGSTAVRSKVSIYKVRTVKLEPESSFTGKERWNFMN